MVAGVDGAAGEAESADALVVGGIAFPAVADRQGILVAQGDIQLRCERHARVGRGHGQRERGGLQTAVELCPDEDAGFGNVAAFEIEGERHPLGQRAGQTAAVHFRLVGRLIGEERIAGVQGIVVEAGKELAAKLVHAGLGEDLDAAVAQTVVLGREGVGIDADLANGGFGRKAPAGKAVDVNLAAVGAGRGPGEGLQVVLQLVRIVRQGVEIGALQHQRAGVAVGIHLDMRVVVADGHLLALRGHAQLNIDVAIATDRERLHLIDREAGLFGHDVVGARDQPDEGEVPQAVGGGCLGQAAGRLQRDHRTGHDSARGVHDRALQAGPGGLRRRAGRERQQKQQREAQAAPGTRENTQKSH